jgi:hypothetical protein
LHRSAIEGAGPLVERLLEPDLQKQFLAPVSHLHLWSQRDDVQVTEAGAALCVDDSRGIRLVGFAFRLLAISSPLQPSLEPILAGARVRQRLLTCMQAPTPNGLEVVGTFLNNILNKVKPQPGDMGVLVDLALEIARAGDAVVQLKLVTDEGNETDWKGNAQYKQQFFTTLHAPLAAVSKLATQGVPLDVGNFLAALQEANLGVHLASAITVPRHCHGLCKSGTP